MGARADLDCLARAAFVTSLMSRLSSSPSHALPVTYRPEIDGLRAFAIVPVILFHLFPRYLPGGFVGVDVFFVISGYLITSILLRELRQARSGGGGVPGLRSGRRPRCLR